MKWRMTDEVTADNFIAAAMMVRARHEDVSGMILMANEYPNLLEVWEIDALKPWAGSEDLPDYTPIQIRPDGTIIKGLNRWRQYKTTGVEFVSVRVVGG